MPLIENRKRGVGQVMLRKGYAANPQVLSRNSYPAVEVAPRRFKKLHVSHRSIAKQTLGRQKQVVQEVENDHHPKATTPSKYCAMKSFQHYSIFPGKNIEA